MTFIPASAIHLLLVSIVFTTFWLILWYFLSLRNEIKLEQKLPFIRATLVITLITVTSDILLSLTIFLLNIYHHFSLTSIERTEYLTITGGLLPLKIIILILTAILVVLFVLFILKRSVKILKQYYLTTLIAVVCTLLMVAMDGLQHLGWFENTKYRLLLFSVSYAYLGQIYLAFMITALVSNASSIIIYANLERFTNPIKYKHRVITFIKFGFVSLIAFIVLSLLPDLLIWFYT
jgi:hypothetical protein